MKIKFIFILLFWTQNIYCQTFEGHFGSNILASYDSYYITPTPQSYIFNFAQTSDDISSRKFQGFSLDQYKFIKTNGDFIIGANFRKNLLVWRVLKDTIIHFRTFSLEENVNDALFLPNHQIVSAFKHGKMEVINFLTKQSVASAQIHEGSITNIAYDGNYIYSISLDSTLKKVKPTNLEIIREIFLEEPLISLSVGKNIMAVSDFAFNIHFMSKNFTNYTKKNGLHQSVISNIQFLYSENSTNYVAFSSWDRSFIIYDYLNNKIILKLVNFADYLWNFILVNEGKEILFITRNGLLYSQGI